MTESDYDTERFDALVREQVHAAATADLPAPAVAAILRAHADAIDERGLDAHAGTATGTPIERPVARAREHSRAD